MHPRHPVYIVSKSRWKTRLTSKLLDVMGFHYWIVVVDAEYQNYVDAVGVDKVLVLPQKYLDEYDTCDDLGFTVSKGPGAARNFAWDHSISLGATSHWVMDDNIEAFYRLNHNIKVRCETSTIFAAAEDFVDRYENVPLAGLNYDSFCKATDKVPPFITNTRIYSCLLIRNDLKYRWRGRYNEDTDLSLRVLKDGDCTIQFNAFLQGKVTTQRMSGGNTKEFYAHEGTLNKSQMLVDLHSDVSKLVWKFNRWHHHVDYKPFKKNKLVKKEHIVIPTGINDMGLVLVETR